MKRKIKLRNKLALYFGAAAFVLILIFFVFSKHMINKSFEDYKISISSRENEYYVELIKEMKERNASDEEIYDTLSVQARGDRLFLKYYDSEDNLIFELMSTPKMGGIQNTSVKNKKVKAMIADIDFISKNITIEGKTAAKIEIGRLGRLNLSNADIEFQKNLGNGIIIIAGIGIIMTMILSFFLSRQISNPIIKVKNAAIEIKKGNYDTKVKDKSNTYEICQLANAVNELGSNLETQENLRIRLTNDVSHELRTPLNILLNQIEALIDGIWEPDRNRLEQCKEEIIRLASLVDDLEKLTDISNYNLYLNIEEFDLNNLVNNVVKQFESKAYEKNINISFESSAKKIFIHGDKDKIKQVVINLLSNAIKFTPEKGSVFLDTNITSGSVLLKVRDTGIGIEQNDIANIFERFYRAENSRSRESGGAGLGLSITRAIVDAHGGKIDVISVPGEGSKFYVKLPLNN